MIIFLLVLLLPLLAILNAIIPLPGFSFFVPLFATFMSTQDAITFATIYFLVGSSIIVFVFRKYLRKELIVLLLPTSIIGALAGSFFSTSLNEKLLTAIILIFVTYFLIKKIRALRESEKTASKPSKRERHTVAFVGIVSGFFQGSGLGGGDVRNGFLYAKGLTMQEVRATTAAVGVGNFLVATGTRAATGHVPFDHAWVFLIIIPLLVGATYIARHITTKLNHKIQNGIVVGLMVVAVGLLVVKLIQS